MQLAAICVCERVPKCFLFFHCSETGDIPGLICKHPSRLQEEQKIINKGTSIVSPHCWPLCCQSSRVVRWPLANLSQHCAAEARHPCFSAFFFVFAPSPRRVSPKTAKPASHNELWGFFVVVVEHFSLPGRLLYTQQGLLRCLLLECCCTLCKQRWDLCVFSHFVVLDVALKAHRRRLQEKKLNWTALRNSEQSKHKAGTWSGNYSRPELHLLSL